MRQCINGVAVKKIYLPAIIFRELQQADFIVFFVDGGQVADTRLAVLQIMEEFGQGLLEFLCRGAAITTDADNQVPWPEHRAALGNACQMGYDAIGLTCVIDLHETFWQGRHHHIGIEKEVTPVDKQSGECR